MTNRVPGVVPPPSDNGRFTNKSIFPAESHSPGDSLPSIVAAPTPERTTPGAWASADKGVVRAERTRTTTLSTPAITKATKTPACRIGEMITGLVFTVFRMSICSSYELSNLPVKSLLFLTF
jgi:hypothetical protein